MTCHSEVTTAFESLYSATARSDFSPAEILRQLRSTGSAYADSTVRTHVCAHMINDGTLLKAGPGRYRLARHRHHPVETSKAEGPMPGGSSRITEDDVKHAVKVHLEADGWTVAVAWGRERGIDIDAHRGTERLVIEAKGEAPAEPQQVNYFLGALGELVQRMTDPLAV